MLRGKYIRTEEIRKKIGDSRRGKGKKLGPPSEEHRRKNSEAHKGVKKGPHSEETKKKMREAALGRKASPETIAKITGNVRSAEHSANISKALVGRKCTSEHARKNSEGHKGSKNSQWIDGRSYEDYPPEFVLLRPKIHERDGYTCQKCGRDHEDNGRQLSVHHIDYNKQNCDEGNLITLCQRCNNRANGNALNQHMHTRFFQQVMINRGIVIRKTG